MNKTESAEEKIKILNAASYSLKDTDLKMSFAYATQAYELAHQEKNEVGMANALFNLGKYYTRLGSHETAMKKYLQALEIAQKQSDDKLIGYAYKIIGNDYYFKGDFEVALQYYKRALQVNEKIKDEETSADLQNNIALVFIGPDDVEVTNTERLDSALMYLLKAAATFKKLNKASKLAGTYLNIGDAKNKSKRYSEAIEYYKKSLDICRAKGLKLKEGFASCNMGISFIRLGRFNEAGLVIESAMEIARKENFMPLLVQVYEARYKLNKSQKNFIVALTNHEKLLRLKDSLLNAQTRNQIEELRTKYESEQKEKENIILLEESKLKEEQLMRARYLLYFAIVFAVAVTILAVVFRRLLVQNRKAKNDLIILNKQIQEQKEEITVQAEELSQANQEVVSINENLEALVKERTSKVLEQNKKLLEYAFHNAHNVRGPLARILGITSLFKTKAVNPEEINFLLNEIINASEELDTVVKEINKVLEDNKTRLKS